MMVKKLGKWVITVVALIIIYYLSVYNPNVLNVINIFCLITGLYILTYPGTFSKTNPETFDLFQDELNQKLKGHENLLSARKDELLADYRGQFIFNTYVIGVPILLTFCLALYGITIGKQMWYEYLLIFFILIFLVLHENNTLKYIPSSRYNRTRLKFFIHELQSKENSHDKPNMIVNNIELNQSEIKNEFSQIVYDNRALIIDNTKIQTINQTQTSIDNQVTNNDNRVLQNNFVTTIDNSKKEIRELNVDSNFWRFFMTINDDVNNKVETLFEIIDNLNSNYFIKNDKFLIKYDSKLKKIVFPVKPTVKLAHFVKFLIYLGILKKSIAEDKNQKCLESIFECEGSEPYYYFKPGEWSKLDSTRNHFKMYYKENDM